MIDYQAKLNHEQLDVVLHGDGACLVLAGAGSGKTRTLVYRVAYLLEQGVDPASILLLTFTNKAAKEMTSRIALLIGAEASGIWGGTFHSIGARSLRRFAAEVGYAPNFSILDQEDGRDLIKGVMKDMSIDPKARRFPTASVVGDVISFARNTQQSIQDALELKHPNFLELAGDIEDIARQYRERKKSANAMDFDDLLTNLALLLEKEFAGARLFDIFKYILVDEYQDTNAIQARIVQGFGRSHRNVLVVGDDAQSIYAFRGADVKNILNFPREWPECRIFKLLQNYRSTSNILDLANESLSHNVAQYEKDLIGVACAGEKPRLVACASAGQEARHVADEILTLRQAGAALANLAVLFRSGAHSQQLEFELMRRDIPYEYRGGQKFFERSHIKDVLAFLRVHANPKDEIAWLRTLGLQTGIGAASASSIVRSTRLHEELARMLEPGNLAIPSRAETGWRDFLGIMDDVSARAPDPSSMIRAVIFSVYQNYLEREYTNWRERQEDLEQLAIFAENYEKLTDFLNDISLYDEIVAGREARGSARDTERIVLSTIHQAKGLEWDTVFIIHLANAAFPNRRALEEDGGLEEERRLFYVAVTRARKRLFLSYPMTIGHETLVFNQPSTFIEEVSSRLFERVEIRFDNSKVKSQKSEFNQGDRWAWGEGGWDEPSIRI